MNLFKKTWHQPKVHEYKLKDDTIFVIATGKYGGVIQFDNIEFRSKVLSQYAPEEFFTVMKDKIFFVSKLGYLRFYEYNKEQYDYQMFKEKEEMDNYYKSVQYKKDRIRSLSQELSKLIEEI